MKSPWEFAFIEIKSLKDLPAPQKFRILVPELGLDSSTIVKVLERVNKIVPVASWNLIRVGDVRSGGRVLT